MSRISTLPADDETEPRCGRCAYIVLGLPGHRCPECGGDLRLVGLKSRHDAEKKRVAIVVAAVVAAAALAWLGRPRAAPLGGAGFVAVVAALVMLLALTSLRLLSLRPWAWAILLAAAPLSFPMSLVGVSYSTLVRGDGALLLAPAMTNAWMIASPALALVWIPALIIMSATGSARFRSRRACAVVMPMVFLLWTPLAAAEGFLSLLSWLGVEDFVAQSVSPDGRAKVVVYSSGFMDCSYGVYVKRNGPLALTCRRLGRVNGDKVRGPIELKWSNDSTLFSFDTPGTTHGTWDVATGRRALVSTP